MKQKILLFLLGSLLSLPAMARDFSYTYEGQTLTYTVIDEEAKTCKTKEGSNGKWMPGNDVSGALIIPEKVNDGNSDYTVTSIGYLAFIHCSGLTSVKIPNTVTYIGNNAFSGCSGLTSVIIPNSVTSVGEYAFFDCSDLIKSAYPNNIEDPFKWGGSAVGYNPEGAIIEDGFIYGPDKTSILFAPLSMEVEYLIPNSVTSIGELAFLGCGGLTSVEIPSSVTSMGYGAFASCTGLTSVEIPNSVTSIGESTFWNCSSLTSVVIPNSVTSI